MRYITILNTNIGMAYSELCNGAIDIVKKCPTRQIRDNLTRNFNIMKDIKVFKLSIARIKIIHFNER